MLSGPNTASISATVATLSWCPCASPGMANDKGWPASTRQVPLYAWLLGESSEVTSVWRALSCDKDLHAHRHRPICRPLPELLATDSPIWTFLGPYLSPISMLRLPLLSHKVDNEGPTQSSVCWEDFPPTVSLRATSSVFIISMYGEQSLVFFLSKQVVLGGLPIPHRLCPVI